MTLSLLDRVYALDPLLGAQVRTRIEDLTRRIEDLEANPGNSQEALIEDLIEKLRKANA